jgi:hypothetical protein
VPLRYSPPGTGPSWNPAIDPAEATSPAANGFAPHPGQRRTVGAGARRPIFLLVALLLGALAIPSATTSADASGRPFADADPGVIEDTAIGTGVGKVSYSGTRTRCGGCAPDPPNHSFRYSLQAGGEPWLSGANGDPLITPVDVDAFCAFRGNLCDVAQVYVARDSWQTIVGQSFIYSNFAGWPGKLVISVPPFPETGASLQTCATGAYDNNWRQFGQTLNATGRQNSIVRLAWEANGNWYPWSGTDPTAYVNCYRHVVDATRSTANPDPQFDWTINSHYSQNPPSHNPLDLYPGDQWVDIVSIDAYDQYPPSHTLDQFNAQANATGGITWLYDFARSHGKLFGVPEWGVASGAGENGGDDNANYIQFMRDWMVARAGHGMYYESYFNNCETHNVGSTIDRPTGPHCLYQNTTAASRYAQLW